MKSAHNSLDKHRVAVVLIGSVALFLNMTAGHQEMVVVTMLSLIVSSAASVVLIPIFGIAGAAMANMAALLILGISTTAFLGMRTGTTITVLKARRGQ